MQEDQRKKIEAKLNQLLTQFEQKKDKKSAVNARSSATKLIRRRKGKPDVHIT